MADNNGRENAMYFIEMGIREFVAEASNRFSEQFNLDYNEVHYLFDDIVEEMLGDN